MPESRGSSFACEASERLSDEGASSLTRSGPVAVDRVVVATEWRGDGWLECLADKSAHRSRGRDFGSNNPRHVTQASPSARASATSCAAETGNSTGRRVVAGFDCHDVFVSKPAWRPRVRGVNILVLVGAGLIFAGLRFTWLLIPGMFAVGLANLILSRARTVVEVNPDSLVLREPAGSTELPWSQVAGAVVQRASVAAFELVVFDSRGQILRTGVRHWSIRRPDDGPVGALAREINLRAETLPGVDDLDRAEIRVALEDQRRTALLAAAGLDERGAERRSDRMMGLWFLTMLGSAVIGGGLVALTGSMWVVYIVVVLSLCGFYVWFSRQPQLPPQRRPVRLRWSRAKPARPNDHT